MKISKKSVEMIKDDCFKTVLSQNRAVMTDVTSYSETTLTVPIKDCLVGSKIIQCKDSAFFLFLNYTLVFKMTKNIALVV